ncbi:MAG TPA: hypothetical protein VMT86_05810 [Bryobacteraceae bacterium]|nr:hypothetical protein [Bryobacteraceae bacterium]
MSIQRWLAALTLSLGAAAFACAQTTSTSGTFTRQFSFLPVGLASTETAQINIVNLASNASSAAASCTGSVSFVNASGAAIGSAASFTVATGETSSVTVPYSATGGSGARVLIRGVVQLTETKPSAPCVLQTSLETFDTNTGVTHLLIGSGDAIGAIAAVRTR